MLAARTPAPAVLQLEDDVTTEPEREENAPEEVADSPAAATQARSDEGIADSPAVAAPARSGEAVADSPAAAAPARSEPGWRRRPALWLGVAAVIAALLIGCGGLATGFVIGRVTDGPGHGHGGGWNRDDRGGRDGRGGGQERRDRRPGMNRNDQPQAPTAPVAPASSVPVPAAT